MRGEEIVRGGDAHVHGVVVGIVVIVVDPFGDDSGEDMTVTVSERVWRGERFDEDSKFSEAREERLVRLCKPGIWLGG